MLQQELGLSGTVSIVEGDNLCVMSGMESGSFDLIYLDPPYNTGVTQRRVLSSGESFSYSDSYENYLSFLLPRLRRGYELLRDGGSMFVHLDYREVHYVKVALDSIFGRSNFINEIIWAYDYGGRSKSRWPAKHDNILWYAKNRKNYRFNYEEIDRMPYLSPERVSKEKSLQGKTLTDTWWHTIVPTQSKENTGYPTQKPLGLLSRIVRVHSMPGDSLLDFFAGSGSFGEAGAMLGRNVTLIDQNPQAITVMRQRLSSYIR